MPPCSSCHLLLPRSLRIAQPLLMLPLRQSHVACVLLLARGARGSVSVFQPLQVSVVHGRDFGQGLGVPAALFLYLPLQLSCARAARALLGLLNAFLLCASSCACVRNAEPGAAAPPAARPAPSLRSRLLCVVCGVCALQSLRSGPFFLHQLRVLLPLRASMASASASAAVGAAWAASACASRPCRRCCSSAVSRRRGPRRRLRRALLSAARSLQIQQQALRRPALCLYAGLCLRKRHAGTYARSASALSMALLLLLLPLLLLLLAQSRLCSEQAHILVQLRLGLRCGLRLCLHGLQRVRRCLCLCLRKCRLLLRGIPLPSQPPPPPARAARKAVSGPPPRACSACSARQTAAQRDGVLRRSDAARAPPAVRTARTRVARLLLLLAPVPGAVCSAFSASRAASARATRASSCSLSLSLSCCSCCCSCCTRAPSACAAVSAASACARRCSSASTSRNLACPCLCSSCRTVPSRSLSLSSMRARASACADASCSCCCCTACTSAPCTSASSPLCAHRFTSSSQARSRSAAALPAHSRAPPHALQSMRAPAPPGWP